jgi:hypothetical protein
MWCKGTKKIYFASLSHSFWGFPSLFSFFFFFFFAFSGLHWKLGWVGMRRKHILFLDPILVSLLLPELDFLSTARMPAAAFTSSRHESCVDPTSLTIQIHRLPLDPSRIAALCDQSIDITGIYYSMWAYILRRGLNDFFFFSTFELIN